MSNETVPQDATAKSDALKAEANSLFAAKHYTEAIEKYTAAIEANPKVAVYYSNRSACYIKTEAYGYAIADANKAIEVDPSYTKGYYRRAIANMALTKFKDSLRDFKIVVKRAPADADAKSKMVECEKIVRRIEFEKAIEHTEVIRSVAETLDVEAMTVEDSYDGPRMDESTKTIDKGFLDQMILRLKDQKKIHKKYVFRIILAVRNIMLESPSLIDIDIPEGGKLTVCGDTHGQYYDLMHIFELNGYPSENHIYLFNGDFVDRGSFSLEVVLTLFAFKWLYPSSLYLARGNHETDNMNKIYGFEGEVKAKFSETMFKLFSETFNALPLAHVIKKKILVVHGGLFSKDDVTLDDIRNIDRLSLRQPGTEGLMCELLWSDPQPEMGRGPSKRGVGIQFGPDVTKNFLEHNGLDMLIRSHEVKENGYVIEHDGKCVTVFSAPNYCDSVGNKGALINITSDMTLDYQTFDAVPHPDVRPMQYASQFGGMLGV
ncbi:Palmitoyl-protein thioesterase 1 [Umbelopsis sp. WA50703]